VSWQVYCCPCKGTQPLASLQNFGASLKDFFGSDIIPPGWNDGTLVLKVLISVTDPNATIGAKVYKFTSLAATSITMRQEN